MLAGIAVVIGLLLFGLISLIWEEIEDFFERILDAILPFIFGIGGIGGIVSGIIVGSFWGGILIGIGAIGCFIAFVIIKDKMEE